jgi:hypothetical protein
MSNMGESTMQSTTSSEQESLEARVKFLERRCSHLKQWLCLAWIAGILSVIGLSTRSDPVVHAKFADFERVSTETIHLRGASGDSYLLDVGEDGKLNVVRSEARPN